MMSIFHALIRKYSKPMLSRIIFSSLVVALCTNPARADQFEIFRKTWADFVEDCQAVFNDLDKFQADKKDEEGYKIKDSEDRKATALNVGADGDYLTVFVDRLDDKSVISCERFYDRYGAFNAKKLAVYLKAFLEEGTAYRVGGGFVPLYDNSTHQFGVSGVFPDYDIPVRVRVFDWGIQFYSEIVIPRNQ